MEKEDFRETEPIDDLLLVLLLMTHGYNDRTRRRLHVPIEGTPYVEIGHYTGGYTRDLHSGSEYYPVSPKLVEELRRGNHVEGEKHLGYTDDRELALRREEWVHREREARTEEFVSEARRFLAKKHPEYPFPDDASSRVHAGHALLVPRVGRPFLALGIAETEGERGVSRSYVVRVNDKLSFFVHLL